MKNSIIAGIMLVLGVFLFTAQGAAAGTTSEVAIIDLTDVVTASDPIYVPLYSGDPYWDFSSGGMVSVTPIWDPTAGVDFVDGPTGAWRLGSDDGTSGPLWTFWPAVYGLPFSFFATEVLMTDEEEWGFDLIHKVYFGVPPWEPVSPATSTDGLATLITLLGIDADLFIFQYTNDPFTPSDNLFDFDLDSAGMVQAITCEQVSEPDDPDPDVPEPASVLCVLAGIGIVVKKLRRR